MDRTQAILLSNLFLPSGPLHRASLQMPIHARPSDSIVIPAFLLFMPNIDLLLRTAARRASSCDVPEM